MLGRLCASDVSQVRSYNVSASYFSPSVMQVTVEILQGLDRWFQRKWPNREGTTPACCCWVVYAGSQTPGVGSRPSY